MESVTALYFESDISFALTSSTFHFKMFHTDFALYAAANQTSRERLILARVKYLNLGPALFLLSHKTKRKKRKGLS